MLGQNLMADSLETSLDHFILSPCNKIVYEKALRWSQEKSDHLMILGHGFSGKTHLKNALQEFMSSSLLEINLNSFTQNHLKEKEPYTHIIIDNFEQIIVSQKQHIIETQLMHIINHCKEHNKQLAFLSSISPKEINYSLPDLASRIKVIEQVKIKEPDESYIPQIILKLFADQQLTIKPNILTYLSKNLPKTHLAIITTINHLIQTAITLQSEINLSFIKKYLI